MEKRVIVVWLSVAMAALLVYSLWEVLSPPGGMELGRAGDLDLRSWNPDATPEVTLNGEWEFFPGQLSPHPDGVPVLRLVPDLWSGPGAGTYRLTIHLPPNTPALALGWTTISSAASFYAGGQCLASVGRPSLNAETEQPRYQPRVVEVPPGNPLVLTVQVSNHEYRNGGLWRELRLGSVAALERDHWFSQLGPFLAAAAILALALNALLHYAFRKQYLVYLFFALFAFTVGFRFLVTGDYPILMIFPDLGYQLLLRLEYATVGLVFLTAMVFLVGFFRGDRRVLVFFIVPAALFLVLVVAAPMPLLSVCLLPYVALMIPQLAAFVVLVWWPTWRQGDSVSWGMLAGALFLVGAGVHDVCIVFFRNTTVSLVPWGLFVFMLLQAAMLAGYFDQKQRRLESLIADLSHLLLDTISGCVLFVNAQGTVVRASEQALQLFGPKVVAQALPKILGCPDFDVQWGAMTEDLQPRNNLSARHGAFRFWVHLLPHQNASGEFEGAVVRIEPESFLDESVLQYQLTVREREVSELVCQGLDTKQISEALFISHSTVKAHLHNLYAKTGTTGKADLVRVLLTQSVSKSSVP